MFVFFGFLFIVNCVCVLGKLKSCGVGDIFLVVFVCYCVVVFVDDVKQGVMRLLVLCMVRVVCEFRGGLVGSWEFFWGLSLGGCWNFELVVQYLVGFVGNF